MLFFPLRIGAKGHASLARDRIELDVTLFGLTVVRLRIKRESGIFRLYVNGAMKKADGKLDAKKLASVAKQFKVEDLRLSGNMLALIGTEDAKNAAMLHVAVLSIFKPLLDSFKVFTSQPGEALELDGKVSVNMTILQLGSLIATGLGW